jgi:hypothetical protein
LPITLIAVTSLYWVDTSHVSEENAELAISGVVMNLLMEENVDVSAGSEISLIGNQSECSGKLFVPSPSSNCFRE